MYCFEKMNNYIHEIIKNLCIFLDYIYLFVKFVKKKEFT